MNSRRRTFLTTVALVLLGVISALAGNSSQRMRPDEAVRGVFAGIQRGFASVGQGVGNTVRSVGELRRVRAEYEALLDDIEQYERLEGTVEALERENDRLREQLGFAARTEEPSLAAQIIARESGTGFFSSLTINRGERHGVEVNQAVVAFVGGEEGLVGRVERVSGGTAVIVPVFAPGSYIGARLERSRHVGLLQGSGDAADALTLQYVPRDARNEIRYGDMVVTSGLNSIFPPEIPIGRVLRVSAPSWDISLVIEVDPVVDYSRLEYVFVLNADGRERSEQ
ncbi:MAG TPA: rod shape-determining protein MreC [Alkalispirochaeta sp.]|nr:rod shape-determining protein MreC [Alkalispirochaeta sp.]